MLQAGNGEILENGCSLPPQTHQAVYDEAVHDSIDDGEWHICQGNCDVVRSWTVQAARKLNDEMGAVLYKQRDPASMQALVQR